MSRFDSFIRRLEAARGLGLAAALVQQLDGDLVGEGAAQEQVVVGETPNLAARLQALAVPGTVVIGPSTQRLTAGLFDYEDLGAVEINGLTAPVAIAHRSKGLAIRTGKLALNLDTRIVTVDDTCSHVFTSQKEAQQYQIRVGRRAS